MREVLKSKKDIIMLIILIFVLNLWFNHITSTSAGDELWNFQNLHKIHNGYKIYDDANIIVTPLFFYIGRLFLFVFGNNVFAFKIYSTVINTIILTTIYLIFRNFEIKKINSFAITLTIYFIAFFAFIGRSATYTMLAMMFALISILVALKNNNNQVKRYNLKQGILCFLILFTKQNMGVYYLIGLTIARIITSENIKTEIKELFKMYLVIFILGMSYLIYLIRSNTLACFLDYVVFGTRDFLKNVSISNWGDQRINVCLIIAFSTVGYSIGMSLLKKGMVSESEKKNIKLLMPISIPMILIAFPIFCQYHIAVGLLCSMIYSAYTISIFINKIGIAKTKQKIIFILIFVYIICCIIGISCMKIFYTNKDHTGVKEKDSPLYGVLLPEGYYNLMDTVTEYIIEKKKDGIDVIMISLASPLYMLPINQSNGEFDCLLDGNLGADGGKGVIETIKQMKNTEILIDNTIKSWQEPEEVRTYIKENLEYVGEIEQFSIYKTK